MQGASSSSQARAGGPGRQPASWQGQGQGQPARGQGHWHKTQDQERAGKGRGGRWHGAGAGCVGRGVVGCEGECAPYSGQQVARGGWDPLLLIETNTQTPIPATPMSISTWPDDAAHLGCSVCRLIIFPRSRPDCLQEGGGRGRGICRHNPACRQHIPNLKPQTQAALCK